MADPIVVTLTDEPDDDESDIDVDKHAKEVQGWIDITAMATVAKSDLKEVLEPLVKTFREQTVLMRDLVNAVEGLSRALAAPE